ncbi:MAG: amidohydrolase family protein [Terriglobales bacterium]
MRSSGFPLPSKANTVLRSAFSRTDSHLARRSLLCLLFITFSTPLLAAVPSRTVTIDHGARDPAVSPDGREIAVSVLGRICLVPAAGGDGEVISSGIGWDRFPTWSPDGQFLAYSHEIEYHSALVLYDLAAGTSAILYQADGVIGQIAYNPAGDNIFFVLRHGQGDAHIWQIPTGGGKPEQITETRRWHEWSFAPSPDGKRLVLSSGLYGGSNLYLLEIQKRTAIRLTNTPLDDTSVAWSHDGKTMAYVETGNGADEIRVEPAGGGEPRVVFRSPYQDKQIAFGRDANYLVVCASRKLYRLDLSTGILQAIPFGVTFHPAQRPPANLVVVHAHLIDGTGRTPIPDATIVIRDGRIAGVGRGQPSADTIAGLPVLDAHDQSVLPGLMDNHYHFWDAFDGAGLLSRGITYIRDPGADLADSMNFKDAIALGLEAGPDIYNAGPLIDGFGSYHPMVAVQIDRPEDAKALVDSFKAQGVDLLKVYFLLRPDVLQAVVKAAHQAHLPVTGHIGVKTSWAQAIEDGIDGLNHIRAWADFLPLSEQPQGANGSLDDDWYPVERMQADWRQIDPGSARVAELIHKMARAKVGFDPTLSIQTPVPFLRQQLSLDQFAFWQQSYTRMSQFVKQAVDAGVPLLAGTDDGSLFDEMEAYEHAGVPRQTIIQAATANGASWLGKQGDFGTIQLGKRADLIFVTGDPLESIKNLRNITLVIKDGQIVFRK